MPDRTFKGHVTEIGNSPIQAAGAARPRTQATNFKVVVILDEQVPDVRPGFTCTADITTATRKDVVGGADSGGGRPRAGLRRQRPDREASRATDKRTPATLEPIAAAAELKPGQTRKETEGVFVVRDGQRRVRADQDGHRRRQVLRGAGGLKAGDQVDHRPVQLGARHGRRRSGEGRQRSRRRNALGRPPAPRHEQVPRIGAASRSTRSGRPSCGRS